MKSIIKYLIANIMLLLSRVYTYSFNKWLQEKRNTLYTMWICNFFGEVGDKLRIAYPLQLQGGGGKRIRIGSRTSFQSHCILGCWVKYGDKHFNPEIIIGDDCSFGEYCHITAITKITIGNGLLTGRFVLITDNNHGVLSEKEADIPPIERLQRPRKRDGKVFPCC